MARPLRIEFENALYHVTARGNEQKPIFRDGNDRRKFLEMLKESRRKYKIVIYCYVLMDNHYHLMVETPRANLSQMMHAQNTSYACYFNQRHSRIGHLFQGRYKAFLVEKESYLLELSRYIHLNPVRAGIVEKPEDYLWSSYRSYINKSNNANWINSTWIKDQFSKNKKLASRHYKRFIEEGMQTQSDSPLRNIYAQTILGSKSFVEDIRKKVEEGKCAKEVPSLKEVAIDLDIEAINQYVASHCNISEEKLLEQKGTNTARKIAIYLTRKHTPLKISEIAEYFGLGHYSAVSKIVSRLEKKSEDDKELANDIEVIEEKLSHVKT